MVARRALLLFSIVIFWGTGFALRINAQSSPPDHLSPRPIAECFKGDLAATCIDGSIWSVDAAVDGRAAAFASNSNRLMAADTNGFTDVFVWQEGDVRRASVGPNGEQANHESDRAAISGNGRYVYFRSRASTLISGTILGYTNLYVKELASGRVALISRDVEGAPMNGVVATDHFAHLDADYSGRYVVFSSKFGKFDENVTDNNQTYDIFFADLDIDGNGDYFDSTPQIHLLSAVPGGSIVGDRDSFEPTISQDGRRVVWLTKAMNLLPELASNSTAVDVVLAQLGVLPDGSVDPTTRTLVAINRMGDDAETLTPSGARLARIDPWRDQVVFVTADTIPNSGDSHAGEDIYLSVGSSSDPNVRHLVWMSHAYTSSEPVDVRVAWDPLVTPGHFSQVAWIAHDDPRTVDDLLIQRNAPFYPPGWATVNWLDADTPSAAAVTGGTLSADGRFAFWTSAESYGYAVPSGSENLFRRQIAPEQLVSLTVDAVGGRANYTPTGVLLSGTMFYSPTQVVTLTPRADIGYRFREWVGVDSREGMTATVLVYGARTVTATFDPMTPPIANSLVLTVTEETVLEGISLTISDPDPDESHSVALAQGPSHGSASVTENVISYQPALNFNGQDVFMLQVTDAYGLQLAQAAQVIVNVTHVGDAPVAENVSVSVAEDTPLPGISLAISDPDPGDTHMLVLAEPPSHGTAALTNHTVSYHPPLNFNGEDEFMLQVVDRDGLQLAAPAQVTVQVTPVNDAPAASDLAFTVAEDTRLDGISLNIADPDPGDSHTTTLVELPDHGTVTFLNNVASYQPAPNFHGQDAFTLQVTDSDDAQLAAPATVIIVVTPVNDAPTAASAQGSGENNGAAIPVFVSVQDPDAGDSYTLAIDTPPTHGSVRVASQLQAQHFEYTPAPNFAGTDSFVFRVTDSGNATLTATATVTVTRTSSPPPPPPPPPPTEEPVYLRLPNLRRSP